MEDGTTGDGEKINMEGGVEDKGVGEGGVPGAPGVDRRNPMNKMERVTFEETIIFF